MKLPASIDLPRILELLRTDPGRNCWVDNHSKEEIPIAKDMKPFVPGMRLYLGTAQKLKAASELTGAVERSATSKKWVNIEAFTLARIAALLQILYRNGCPLIDPNYPDRPIVFWDEEDGLAAWEQIAHLHNQRFDPYVGLPPVLAAYYQPGRLFTPTAYAEHSADRRMPATLAISKDAQLVEDAEDRGVDLLKFLIKADMSRKGVASLEDYAAALIAERLSLSVEEAVRRADYLKLITGLRDIIHRSKLPEKRDAVFITLSSSLQTVEGQSFNGDTVELLRYCGILNGNNSTSTIR